MTRACSAHRSRPPLWPHQERMFLSPERAWRRVSRPKRAASARGMTRAARRYVVDHGTPLRRVVEQARAIMRAASRGARASARARPDDTLAEVREVAAGRTVHPSSREDDGRVGFTAIRSYSRRRTRRGRRLTRACSAHRSRPPLCPHQERMFLPPLRADPTRWLRPDPLRCRADPTLWLRLPLCAGRRSGRCRRTPSRSVASAPLRLGPRRCARLPAC